MYICQQVYLMFSGVGGRVNSIILLIFFFKNRDNIYSCIRHAYCKVTNCGSNPKIIGYRPNKSNTINL